MATQHKISEAFSEILELTNESKKKLDEVFSEINTSEFKCPHIIVEGLDDDHCDEITSELIEFIVAKEEVRECNFSKREKAGDVAAHLTNLNELDLIIVRNVNNLTKSVRDIFYEALNTFSLDLTVGDGAAARNVKIELAKFTAILIGNNIKNLDAIVGGSVILQFTKTSGTLYEITIKNRGLKAEKKLRVSEIYKKIEEDEEEQMQATEAIIKKNKELEKFIPTEQVGTHLSLAQQKIRDQALEDAGSDAFWGFIGWSIALIIIIAIGTISVLGPSVNSEIKLVAIACLSSISVFLYWKYRYEARKLAKMSEQAAALRCSVCSQPFSIEKTSSSSSLITAIPRTEQKASNGILHDGSNTEGRRYSEITTTTWVEETYKVTNYFQCVSCSDQYSRTHNEQRTRDRNSSTVKKFY